MEWISVEDRLPEEEGHYLTAYEIDGIRGIYHELQVGFFRVIHGSGWDNNNFAGMRISHWMPLPEPPKDL